MLKRTNVSIVLVVSPRSVTRPKHQPRPQLPIIKFITAIASTAGNHRVTRATSKFNKNTHQTRKPSPYQYVCIDKSIYVTVIFTYRSRSVHMNLLRVAISRAAIYHTLPTKSYYIHPSGSHLVSISVLPCHQRYHKQGRAKVMVLE